MHRCCVFVFLFLVGSCLLCGCSSRSSDKEEAIEKTGEPQTAEVLRDENKPGCTIAPGTSRSFRLSGPLPFFHSTDTSPTLAVEFGLAGNSWKENGLGVTIDSSEISQESANVWTYKSEIHDRKTGDVRIQNRPLDLAGNPASFTYEIAAPGQAFGGDILVQDGKAHQFIEQGNMPLSEVKKVWKIDERLAEVKEKLKIAREFDESLIETRPFAFYRFAVDFTVTVPDQDKLAEIDKASRSDEVDLLFHPRKVVFKNSGASREWTMEESFNRRPVVLSLSRKPGGGYKDVVIKTFSAGCELTCE